MPVTDSPTREIDDDAAHRDAGPIMRALAWVAVAVAALWLVMSFTYPFGWDQGILSWVGGVIVRGGMPYRDAWDLKGPLVYYIYALAQALFGVHLWSIRILDAALLVAATVSVWRAASALTDGVTARWAAILFFLWYASHSYWHTAQPDGWTGMLLIIALAPVISRTEPLRSGPMALVGVCVGIITLFKPICVIFLLLPLAHISVERTSRRATLYVGVMAGWLLPIALTAGWFALRGALDELIAVHVRYSAVYAGLSPGDRLRGLVEYFLSGPVVAVAVPIVLYGGVVLWRRRRPVGILLVLWAALVIFSVALQNRFYAYHWLPLLPAASLLGAVGFHHVRARMTMLAHVMGGVILIHCLAPIVLEEVRFASWLTGRMDREAYYDAYGEPGDGMRAVQWLREEGQPGEVFIFGWDSAVAWLSERPIVSRFGFSMPLLMGEGLEIRSQYRAELLHALRATPPHYVVVGTQSERILGARLTIADFPELADLVSGTYREVQRFGKLTIYEISR